MKKIKVVLRGIVWFVALYHLGFAIILNLPPSTVEALLGNIIGASRVPQESAPLLAPMLSAYMFVFGIGMALAAYDPVKNRALLTLGVILVLLRVLQRIFTLPNVEAGLGITSAMNWILVLALCGFAAALLAYRIIILRETSRGVARAN